MGARLLVIGSTNVDLLATVPRHPSPGETLLGTGGQRAAGGKGANQALAAALQGADVTFVGAVGEDADAELALAGMRAAGVDLDSVVTVPESPTGLAIITVSQDGENTIVVIPGANAHVGVEAATTAVAGMGEGDLLLMQGEVPRATMEAAARAARDADRRVVLNVAPWMALDHDVLTAADPLVLNEHEAQLALAELGLSPDGDSPEAAATALRVAGTPSVVITLGAEGAVAASQDSPTTQVPSPTVTAIDSTGAGDAFTGALAARLLEGDDLTTAVGHAVRVGAFAVQHQGAQPSYPELDAELP
ncbi:ribokinase [Ornithinimicrobium ciconiae]|uniref:Ribokinase n=1 Tax=Ornithinimicrobium ciconiae TaxID=2594265 RepID=A0A516GDB3_9MICO|nr:ribokinase [Ornithinimicrobium ciconiae]QDO89497.1 ribokinase [Ornithinimicrobium ciconiae]